MVDAESYAAVEKISCTGGDSESSRSSKRNLARKARKSEIASGNVLKNKKENGQYLAPDIPLGSGRGASIGDNIPLRMVPHSGRFPNNARRIWVKVLEETQASVSPCWLEGWTQIAVPNGDIPACRSAPTRYPCDLQPSVLSHNPTSPPKNVEPRKAATVSGPSKTVQRHHYCRIR